MGNRAVLAFRDSEGKIEKFGIYLHWNGGIESVAAFLEYAEEVGVRGHETGYFASRLTQIIGNFMEGTLSLGLVSINTDNLASNDLGDNGVYVIDCSGKLKGDKRIVEQWHEGYGGKKDRKVSGKDIAKMLAAEIGRRDAILVDVVESNYDLDWRSNSDRGAL